MGVLCMAVHVPPEGGRVVVVTGGDDQAVCVAEVELRDNSVKPFNLGSPRGGETTSCSNEKISAGKRCDSVGMSSTTAAVPLQISPAAFAEQVWQRRSHPRAHMRQEVHQIPAVFLRMQEQK